MASESSRLVVPPPNAEQVYREEPMRWVALFQFACMNMNASIGWITYGTVLHESMSYFGMTKFETNFLNVAYVINYLVMIYPAMRLFDRYGMYVGFKVASVCNLTAQCIKIFAVIVYPNFWILLLGQLCQAQTMMITYMGPPPLSSTWFAAPYQTLSTTAGTMAMNIGLAFGLLLPPLFVSPTNNNSGAWLGLFFLQGSISLLDLILIFCVVPRQPVEPPSAFAALHRSVREEAERKRQGRPSSHELTLLQPEDGQPLASMDNEPMSVRDMCAELLGRRSFRMFCIVTGFGLGVAWAFSGLLTQILFPFGFSNRVSGTIGFTAIMTGVIVAFFVGAAVDRLHIYKNTMVAAMAALLVTTVAIMLELNFNRQPESVVAAVFAAYVVSGIAQSCTLSIAMEFAVELGFPIDAAITSAVVILGPNAVQLVSMLSLPAIMGAPTTTAGATWALGILAGMAVVAMTCALLTKEELHRKEYEASVAGSVPVTDAETPAASGVPASPGGFKADMA